MWKIVYQITPSVLNQLKLQNNISTESLNIGREVWFRKWFLTEKEPCTSTHTRYKVYEINTWVTIHDLPPATHFITAIQIEHTTHSRVYQVTDLYKPSLPKCTKTLVHYSATFDGGGGSTETEVDLG